MVDYLDAPTPYIIGVPLDLWKQIKKTKGRLPSDAVVYHMEKSLFLHKDKMPEIPEKIAKSMMECLETAKIECENEVSAVVSIITGGCYCMGKSQGKNIQGLHGFAGEFPILFQRPGWL